MNPYEPVDPRPNTAIPEESSEILHDGFVQEITEDADDEKITTTTVEVPTEEKTSVANRDFSEDLKLYMAKYPAYQHMLGMEVPMRSYMWSFFSGIVNMALCEEILPRVNKTGRYADKASVRDCLNRASRMLDYIIEHIDYSEDGWKESISDDMLKVVLMIAWAYLKFKNYEDKFVVPTPPEEKDIIEEIVEKEPGE